MGRWAAPRTQAASEETQAGAGPWEEGSEAWGRQDPETADGRGTAECSDGESRMLAFDKKREMPGFDCSV